MKRLGLVIGGVLAIIGACNQLADIHPPSTLCGNGVVDDGEECDDGNLDSTDDCTVECRNPRCGDGFVNGSAEEWDDGNDEPMDGCEGCELTAIGGSGGSGGSGGDGGSGGSGGSGGGPVDQCLDGQDQGVVTDASSMFQDKVIACGQANLGSEPQTLDCIKMIGFTDGCAQCFDDTIQCV